MGYKITRKMIDRAENVHFRREDTPSLVKLHAMNYAYYKERGKTKSAKQFVTRPQVKRLGERLLMKPARKIQRRRRSYGGGLNLNIWGR